MTLSVETVLSLLEAHPYLLLFPLILLEGPIATIGAGLLVATGLMAWPLAYAIAVAADLAGDSLYFGLGRGARRPGAGRLLARLGLGPERLEAMETSFSGNAGRAILGAKVVDAAAIPVFVTAGLTKVGYARFLGWTLAATMPKAALLMIVGYFASQQAIALLQSLSPVPVLVLALFVVASAATLILSKKIRELAPMHAKQTAIKEEN
jgi:membrane protein DedA with SNARE-associated domain